MIPALGDVPLEYQVRDNTAKEIAIVRAFIDAGVAEPGDWASCRRDPARFLERTLRRWMDDAGAANGMLHLRAVLLDRFSNWTEGAMDDDPAFELGVAIGSAYAHRSVMGPTLELLEHACTHQGLPHTWYRLVVGSLARFVGVWDWHSGSHMIEGIVEADMERRAYEAEEAGGKPPRHDHKEYLRQVETRTANLLPAVLRTKARPMSMDRFRAMSRNGEFSGRAQLLVQAAVDLADAAAAVPQSKQPVFEWGVPWEFGPYPSLLIVEAADDDTQGLFDESMDELSQMGEPVAPALVLPIPLSKPTRIRAAVKTLRGTLRVLDKGAQLLRIVEQGGTDARALASVLA